MPLQDQKRLLNAGQTFTLRLKIPPGKTLFKDHIYGAITVNNEEIDDFIIARSDGTPTYNFTVVVDDHTMGISHVIRGEDHISNTPKQLLIYGALGYPVPEFAHLPMILGPDKKRLSKRHGAAGIQEFRDAGYAADALLNYLVMLGWNPGTEQELFTREEMVAQFAIQKVQKKGAVYDEKKLHWIAGQHLARVSEDEILQSIRSEEPNWQRHAKDEYIHHILKLMKIRAKTFNELKDMTGYFFSDPVTFDQEAAAKRWKDKSLNKLIEKYIQRLENIANWSAADLETALRATAEDMAVSAAKLIHPVRLAVSGQLEGPGLFELLELLGKMTCIRRLRKALTIFPLTND
jgi:glutamyl-tRNA synthetase